MSISVLSASAEKRRHFENVKRHFKSMSNVRRPTMCQALTLSIEKETQIYLKYHICVYLWNGMIWNCHHWANFYLLCGKYIYLSLVLYKAPRVKKMRGLAGGRALMPEKVRDSTSSNCNFNLREAWETWAERAGKVAWALGQNYNTSGGILYLEVKYSLRTWFILKTLNHSGI